MYLRHETGKEGEKEVEEYLIKNNYRIIQKNFSCYFVEIDIIAKDKQELVIIEVKTRKNKKYGLPSEAITKQKKKHLYKTAQYYLYIKKLENNPVRIDVIEVYFLNDKHYIHHIKKAIVESF